MRILEGRSLWWLITLVGVGGNLFLVYLYSSDFLATGVAVAAVLVAYAVGRKSDRLRGENEPKFD